MLSGTKTLYEVRVENVGFSLFTEWLANSSVGGRYFQCFAKVLLIGLWACVTTSNATIIDHYVKTERKKCVSPQMAFSVISI